MLLQELDSSAPDVGQNQRTPAAFSGPSTDAEGFNELPKNVTLLEGVIRKLRDKVAHAFMSNLIHPC
jgi:hypothetical protein